MNIGDVFICNLFPKRSIRLLRTFTKNSSDRYYEFRPSGWFVQGIADGQDYGSEYEICTDVVIGNWSAVNV